MLATFSDFIDDKPDVHYQRHGLACYIDNGNNATEIDRIHRITPLGLIWETTPPLNLLLFVEEMDFPADMGKLF